MLEIKPHLTPQRCVPRPLLWGHICHGFYLNVLILYQKYKIERVNFMVSNRENGLLYGELAEGWGPGDEAASSGCDQEPEGRAHENLLLTRPISSTLGGVLNASLHGPRASQGVCVC